MALTPEAASWRGRRIVLTVLLIAPVPLFAIELLASFLMHHVDFESFPPRAWLVIHFLGRYSLLAFAVSLSLAMLVFTFDAVFNRSLRYHIRIIWAIGLLWGFPFVSIVYYWFYVRKRPVRGPALREGRKTAMDEPATGAGRAGRGAPAAPAGPRDPSA